MRTPDWQSDDGAIRLYLGDCLDLLPTIPAGAVDAVVTDPPYGINYEASRYQNAIHNGVIHGDDSSFNPSPLLTLQVPSVIWGGNNFAELLPRGGWLCWDKRTNEDADRILGSPFELAWCSDRQKFRIIRLLHGGAVNADGTGPRVHPTQKPIRLMAWCLDVVRGNTIFDPYMGSGTTAIACIRTGRRFIGCEIEPRYFDIAVRRIKAELAQPRLFTAPEPVHEQTTMFA